MRTETQPYEIHPKLRDFRTFLCMVWQHLNLPQPTEVQLDIADWLQTGPRRKVTEALRGIGKSWITSAYVIWRLYLDPQLNFLVVSASKERADSFSTFTLRLINEIPLLSPLIPKMNQRCSMIAFDVAPAEPDHAPSVKSIGIFGQMTGSRADEIIGDDIEVSNNSDTQLKRDKLSEVIKEFEAILKPGGKITYLGTPQTEMSIYNILPERGYEIRTWPARYPDDVDYKCDRTRLSPMLENKLSHNPALAGKPTDPERFDDKDLREREASYARSGFALQYMLDTSLSDADKYPLKVKDLILYDTTVDIAPEKIAWSADPRYIVQDIYNCAMAGDHFYRHLWLADKMLPYQTTVMAIDPSGRGQDETAVVIVKSLNGNLYLRRCIGFRDGYSDKTLTQIVNLAKAEQVNKILIESNFGDGMFQALLQPYLAKIYPCTCEEFRSTVQKEKRIIDTLEPVMNQHRLIIDPQVIRDDLETTQGLPADVALSYRLIYQMTRVCRIKGSLRHDDRLDALTAAVAYFVEQMKLDQNKQENKRKLNEFKAELEVFYSNGRKSNLDKMILGIPLDAKYRRPRRRQDCF